MEGGGAPPGRPEGGCTYYLPRGALRAPYIFGFDPDGGKSALRAPTQRRRGVPLDGSTAKSMGWGYTPWRLRCAGKTMGWEGALRDAPPQHVQGCHLGPAAPPSPPPPHASSPQLSFITVTNPAATPGDPVRGAGSWARDAGHALDTRPSLHWGRPDVAELHAASQKLPQTNTLRYDVHASCVLLLMPLCAQIRKSGRDLASNSGTTLAWRGAPRSGAKKKTGF
eukprot:gene22400-biopygen4233